MCFGLSGVEGVSRLSPTSLWSPTEDSCPPPFEFQACGSPCTGLCATYLSHGLCQNLPPCQPGCYCPEVRGGTGGGDVPQEKGVSVPLLHFLPSVMPL